MTDPGLYVSDAELIRRLGVPEKQARVALRDLARDPRFPPKDKLLGDRRYWPAVKLYLDRRAGISIAAGPAPQAPDGPENWNHDATKHRQRARHPVAPPH